VEQTLSQSLSCHRARIKLVAAFIVALVTVKNIHWPTMTVRGLLAECLKIRRHFCWGA
jgi:hypothetical protein